MIDYQPLDRLPVDIINDWRALLHKATPTSEGVFRLVHIRRSAGDYEDQRVTVLVIDENGFPLPNVKVAFSYSTAKQYTLNNEFLWMPPVPWKAFIVPTQGGGQIDQIQGSPVREGEAGGITVYLFEPEYSSDIVKGCGMLADHTGLHLTFQLRRSNVYPLHIRVAAIEARLDQLEAIIAEKTNTDPKAGIVS